MHKNITFDITTEEYRGRWEAQLRIFRPGQEAPHLLLAEGASEKEAREALHCSVYAFTDGLRAASLGRGEMSDEIAQLLDGCIRFSVRS